MSFKSAHWRKEKGIVVFDVCRTAFRACGMGRIPERIPQFGHYRLVFLFYALLSAFVWGHEIFSSKLRFAGD
jgi:hypothetical protein